MSQATQILGARRAPHVRVVTAVSAAHFVSHYYIIVLAPLLPFVRADYGVSYTEIGLAFAAFNIVSALLQTPAGFLVDRLGARRLLIVGLLIGAAAFAVVGLTHSFWLLIAMFALAGVGNTVYHPADYALLSHHVPGDRIGQAFSIHTFAGILGSAAAALMLATRDPGAPSRTTRDAVGAGEAGWKLLASPPIVRNLVFFVLLAMISGGIYNYSVVALGALHATPVTTANAALTAYLTLSALGVLAGGALVGRTSRHGTVASLGLAAMALLTALVAEIDLDGAVLIATMAVNGFFSGVIMPSRDMIVRAVTPPGSFGKVFGFVTTGFNIGGIIAPLIFGAIMDRGSPRLVFLGVAAFTLMAIATVLSRPRRPA